ncbi:MAG TPA: PRC-barrel domain-containing protein [Planctomycetaceae bacterium]|nr:PRC-barrel domain-containing protein [Planctomycetaceae bacterium]
MFVSVRKLLDLALAACIAYPTAQSAFAQVRPVGPPAGAPPAQVAPNGQLGPNRTVAPDARRDQGRFLQGSVILGSNVLLQGGANFGTVRDFVISDSGCLEYAVIAGDGGLVAIPWGAGMFDVGRRAFTVDFGRDRIRDLPRIRDVSELRDPQMQQRVQTFFRGNHGARGDMRGNNNRQDNGQRGAENQPQQNGRTVRGAAQPPRTPGNERPANAGNERGNERRER